MEKNMTDMTGVAAAALSTDMTTQQATEGRVPETIPQLRTDKGVWETVVALFKRDGLKGDRRVEMYCRMLFLFNVEVQELEEWSESLRIDDIFNTFLKDLIEHEAKTGKADEVARQFLSSYRASPELKALFPPPTELPVIRDPEKVERTHSYTAKNWRLEAAYWIMTRHEAYSMMCQFAQQMKERKRRFGINLLRERLRWEAVYEYGSDRYKFCNSMSPYVARYMIQQDPELDKYIKCRKTKW
jgi:hypothetical protein